LVGTGDLKYQQLNAYDSVRLTIVGNKDDSPISQAHELEQSGLPLILQNTIVGPSDLAGDDEKSLPTEQLRQFMAEEMAGMVKEFKASMKKQEQEYLQKIRAQSARLNELDVHVKSLRALPSSRDRPSRDPDSDHVGMDELRSHIQWLANENVELRKSLNKQLKEKDDTIKALHNNFKEFRAQTTEQLNKMRVNMRELNQQHAALVTEAKSKDPILKELVGVIQRNKSSGVRRISETSQEPSQGVLAGECYATANVGDDIVTDANQVIQQPEKQVSLCSA
jgi:hypothetical protein